MSYRILLSSLLLTMMAAPLGAQQQVILPSAGSSGRKLAFLLPDFLQDTLQGVPDALRTTLSNSIGPNLNVSSLNSSVATELSNLPIPSPASGQRFDTNLGVDVPRSLGPILTERAETIGRDKYFFAVTYQRFSFDRIDEVDFGNLNLKIPIPLAPGVTGVVNAMSSISLTISETTAHFTYGITDWLDASYAFPIVTSTLASSTQGTVSIPGLFNGVLLPSSIRGSSTGLGDGIARVKARLIKLSGVTVAFANDIRLPTGDEFNYHGAGAYGVKPFVIASLNGRFVSPHLNAGYQWNGRSYMGSTSGTTKERLPGQLFYSVGVDASLSPRLTAAFDVLDQIVINGRRSFLQSSVIDGTAYQTVAFPNQTRHEVNGAAGFKARLTHDVVLTGNLLFRMNETGLRSRVVPLLGLSYLF